MAVGRACGYLVAAGVPVLHQGTGQLRKGVARQGSDETRILRRQEFEVTEGSNSVREAHGLRADLKL